MSRSSFLRTLFSRTIHFVDLLVLAVAFPVFVVAGLPLMGWVWAAAIWIAQRALQIVIERRISGEENFKLALGLKGFGVLTRGWGAAIAVLVVGAADGSVGIAAAVLIMCLFTAYFGQALLTRYLASGGTLSHPLEEGVR